MNEESTQKQGLLNRLVKIRLLLYAGILFAAIFLCRAWDIAAFADAGLSKFHKNFSPEIGFFKLEWRYFMEITSNFGAIVS